MMSKNDEIVHPERKEKTLKTKANTVLMLKISRIMPMENDQDFDGYVHSFLSFAVVNAVRLYRIYFRTWL